METREQILLASLQLFSRRGFDAVSVSDIAAAVGITKGALYRHYENKQAIFDAILRRMEEKDAEEARENDLPEENHTAPQAVSLDDILAFTRTMYLYWTEDPFASAFRRMILLESFARPDMAVLEKQYLSEGPLGYVEMLFASIGIDDPGESALLFYGPVYLLYGMEDHTAAAARLEKHLARMKHYLEETKHG